MKLSMYPIKYCTVVLFSVISLPAFSQGNVGIGITAPLVPLHVKSTTYSDILRVEGITPRISFWNLETPDGGGSVWAKSTGMDISSHLPISGMALPVTISPGLSVTATFLANGNVGIGTATPQTKLEVKNAGNAAIRIRSNNYSDSTRLIFSNRNPSEQGTDFIFSSNQETGLNILTTSDLPANNNASVLFLSPQGKVGIGTLTPSFALDVADRIRVRNGASGTAGIWLNKIDNSSPAGFIGNYDDTHIGLYGSNGAAWSLLMNTANGNVGIGNSSPANKLDVNGNINVTGLLKINSNSGTAGQVLVSNGAAPATWQNSALSNNTRFSVTMTSVSAGVGNMPFTTRYNLNPANVTIGANSITINYPGLYHFEGHLASYVFVTAPSSSPYYGFSLNTASVSYELRRNHTIPAEGGGFYGDNLNFCIDIYFNAFQTLVLPYNFFTGGGTSNGLDGWFTGYLISD